MTTAQTVENSVTDNCLSEDYSGGPDDHTRQTAVDASQRKFAKPELAHGLAKGGQTDSQVAKAVHFTHIIG